MKIRAITLDNVRRFTDPVTIGPIGDGVTLLCEPNEAGKSTLFDALHALFFIKHNSQAKDIKALRPHSGGTISVTCELEHDGAQWRVRKDWFTGASAKVWRDGALVHQAEAAEDWLAALVAGTAGGPAGLLWVRQGRVSLQPRDRSEQKEERDQRQGLLNAISGAMEQVTGGERMDRIRNSVASDLDALQTSRGPRKNGRWAEALEIVTDLQARETELAALVADLRSDLDQRRVLLADLSALQDEEAARKRQGDFAEAERALRTAEGLSHELATARTKADLASLTAQNALDDMARRNALWAELTDATAAQETAREAHIETAGQAAQAAKKDDAAQKAMTAAAAQHEAARALLDQLDAAEKSQRAQQERDRLKAAVEQAQAADDTRIAQAAIVAKGPDRRTLVQIEQLAQDVATKEAVRDAAAPQLSAKYEAGAAPVTIAGAPLHEGKALPLPPGGQIVIPGTGTLHIATTDAAADGALATAKAKLAQALQAGGWGGIDEVRAAARRWSDAERAVDIAVKTLATIAPDGIDDLRVRLATIAQDAAHETMPEHNRDALQQAVQDAALALSTAQSTQNKTAQMRQSTAIAAAKADNRERAAQDRMAQAIRAVEGLPEPDSTDAQAKLAALQQAAQAAEQAASALESRVPDMATLQARHDRLKAVAEAAITEAAQIDKQIGTLNGRIETRSNEGVEEALEDTRGQLISAQSTLARVVREKDVLARLLEALDAAQKAARETYFAPVAEELRPLLSDLWEDAELQWSDDTLLPVSLLRKGTEEAIDVLSGGTQEQIAFLVRLAFARLLAKSGRHAPLILDDALVYSDDARIERMFDALHGSAGDLQIIVLSCRSRAFRDLGAPRLSFTPAGSAP